MDSPGTLLTVVLAGAAGACLLAVLGTLVNLYSLVRWRRPSRFGIRLRLTMGGLGSMLASMAIVVLALSYPEFGSAALWAIAALAFGFGALIFGAGIRARVDVVRPSTPAAQATRRASLLLAIWLLPSFVLAIWGVLTLTSHLHASVVAVSFAGTLALFGTYVFVRTTKMPLRLRFGALEGSSFLLAIAIVSLLNTLFLLTLDLPG